MAQSLCAPQGPRPSSSSCSSRNSSSPPGGAHFLRVSAGQRPDVLKAAATQWHGWCTALTAVRCSYCFCCCCQRGRLLQLLWLLLLCARCGAPALLLIMRPCGVGVEIH